jgi:hypothetical protein
VGGSGFFVSIRATEGTGHADRLLKIGVGFLDSSRRITCRNKHALTSIPQPFRREKPSGRILSVANEVRSSRNVCEILGCEDGSDSPLPFSSRLQAMNRSA